MKTTGRASLRMAFVALVAGLTTVAWGAEAPPAPEAPSTVGARNRPTSALVQEGVDTLRTGTEPPGGPPPRQVVAPDSARLDTLVAQIASQLRCTVCRNQSVLESTATLSRQMQSVIREKLAAGESPEEIKAYFVDKYGEWILLRPEPEGIGLLVYVLPALALLGGGIVVFRVLRRWSRAPAGGTDPAGGGGAAIPGGESTEAGLEGLPPEEREWIRQQVGSG